MSQPKEQGHWIILDLSYGDYMLNKATVTDQLDGNVFQLKLPNLDMLLPHMEQLGKKSFTF